MSTMLVLRGQAGIEEEGQTTGLHTQLITFFSWERQRECVSGVGVFGE